MRVEIHVDASTMPNNPGNVGVGFHARVGNKQVISWAYCGMGTSNFGELASVAFALDVIRPARRDSVLVVTDSTYALMTLTGEWPMGANEALVLAVRKKIEAHGAILDYIKGHDGVAGNEAADFAAGQAAVLGMEIEDTPVYLVEGFASRSLRLLELEVVPHIRQLGWRFQKEIRSIHRQVRGGKIRTTANDEMFILTALRGLGKENLLAEAEHDRVRDPGQEEGRTPARGTHSRPARRLPVHRQGAR